MNNDASLDHSGNNPATHYTQPESVRWWIPLVASTAGLLVLLFGTAAVMGGLVNSAAEALGS